MSSVRILIADDHAMMRRGLRALLESHPDWSVCGEAADGVEAISKAKELKPQIALLDVSMPQMNGLEAARTMRRETPDCQILIVSQNDPVLMQKEAAQAGAQGFVQKSRVAQDLVTAVEALLVRGAGWNGDQRKPNLDQVDSTGPDDQSFPVGDPECLDPERKLRLDAEMLAAIVASSDDAIVSKNLRGVITTWNLGAERIFGYTAEEAIGKHITLIIPPDRREEENEILRRLKRGEKVDHFNTVRMRKGGATFDVSVTISPLRDFNGTVIGASKVARDISKQKRAEQALRESEERFRALVNASSYVVYRMNRDWREMSRLDGQGDIPDVAGPTTDWIEAYIHPDDQAAVRQKIQDAIRTKGLFELEHRMRRPDGRITWTLSRAVPLLDEDGEIIEWFGAASDVTPRRMAEEAYRNLAESLDTEVRARTQELVERNADVLRHSEQLRDLSQHLLQARDEERRHVARELHDSAGQTLTVLGMNLAGLAQRAQETAPQFAASVQDAQQLVQQLHQEIRTTSYLLHPPLLDETGLASALSWYTDGLAERSALAVELKISEDFGRIPRDLELVVFRLVQECLTNIHRHSGASQALIEIERRNGFVSVDVADNGHGMTGDRLKQIQTGGYGLGLRGIRERVRLFQGEMRIESDSSGTRVLVKIPVPEPAPKPGESLEASAA